MNHGHETPAQIDMTAFREGGVETPYGPHTVHFDDEGYSIDNPYAAHQPQPGPVEAAVEYPQAQMFETSAETIDQPAGRLRLAARGLARWVRQKFTRGDDRRPAEQGEEHEAGSEVEAFWGERHSIARAQSFSEQVAEVRLQPWERQNIIHADPSTILDTGRNRIRRSRDTFTEQEGVLDLDNFLLDVIATGSQYNDPKSAEMVDAANRMRRNFNFLGKKEYEVACEGIAHAWKEHLVKHPDAVINIFNPRVSEDEPLKSYNVVLRDIQSKFAALTESDPQLAAKLRTNPDEWVDSKNAKLLVVDDWITSGTTIRNNAADAIREARRRGLNGLAHKTEAHVLITRQGEPRWQWGINNGRDEFKLRSYYETETRDYFAPSGSHSSVDYTFETPLENMTTYLRERGVHREMPLLAHIQRRYGEAEDEPRDMHSITSQQTLHEIGVLNGVMRDINSEITTLSSRTDAEAIYMLGAHRDSARAVEHRIAVLTDQYQGAQAHRAYIDAHSKPVGVAA